MNMHIKPMPSIEWLNERFTYEPATGLLRHRKWTGGTAHAGTVAGARLKSGYIRVACQGDYYLAHRLIWKMMTGDDPPAEIDHIDGLRANNRWSNLRCASRAENSHNTRRPSTNTSGFKGVYWHEKAAKWRAVIKNGGDTPIHLGYFTRPEDAHAAYRAAAERMFGEFARPA